MTNHNIENDFKTGYTFDDVLLIPQRSSISSRKDTNLQSNLTKNIKLNIPIVSANMDTVTESSMAIKIASLGGIGIIHRFMTIEEQISEVLSVKRSEGIVIEQPVTINQDGNVGQIKELMSLHKIGGILVKDNSNKLLGIVTKRDLFFEYEDSKSVQDVMTKDLITALEGTSLDDAKKIFINNKIEKLPIVNSSNELVGLITSKDIYKRDKFPISSKDDKGRLMVGAAIGVREEDIERAVKLTEAGADTIVIDIAHGHSDHTINMLSKIKEKIGKVDIIVGNVATGEGTKDLIEAGADAVKVGVGSGSICITRIVTGAGVPQLTAILDCVSIANEYKIPIIADGGIRNSGDITKAIAAGASTVMIGSMLAGTDESPGVIVSRPNGRYKMTRGMASLGAAVDRSIKETKSMDEEEMLEYVPEGVEALVQYRGQASEVIGKLVGGLRSGLSYCNSKNIDELQKNSKFIRITGAGKAESGAHDVLVD
ncbi:MAG: IMP dehydrogenase [Thaumarchaeota archaeon]|nr:IMP dehydrogenase [Nitrososphaerota archaeon]|tara:strand:+ start:4903 stop:6354 length:1452 start_codon:yes stop_codon:yes gene_type:complete